MRSNIPLTKVPERIEKTDSFTSLFVCLGVGGHEGRPIKEMIQENFPLLSVQ